MRWNIFRFLSVIVAVALLAVLCVPVFATSNSSYEQRVGWWEWVSHFPVVKEIFGYASGSVCPKSDDGYHHSSSYEVDEKNGWFISICSSCGQRFKAYESDLKQSYDNQVAELPATGITSAGQLIWQPTVKDIVFPFTFRGLLSESASVNVLPWSHVSGASESSLSANSSGTGFDMRVQNCSSIVFAELSIKFNAPVSGSYFCGPYSFSYSVVSRPNGEIVSDTKFVDENLSPLYVSFGNAISFNFGRTFQSAQCSSGVASFNFPIYRVVPDSALDTSAGGQYSVTTRPTAITGGNYGIVGDDGEITTITNNNQIINETNNTYYNPATGETKPILDWSYNYTDRSYKVTLESGDTYTITYGDENIVIKEGDVTYNIYYMVDGTGSGDPDPSPSVSVCPHVWTETSRTEPGCTSPGSASFSCEKCGEAKTDKLPATGHTWQVLRTVQTAYDEEGNLIQQGYTIYQCAVCSEQYKDDQGTGPPGGGDKDDDKETIWDKIANFFGSIVDGIAGIFEAILGKLLDALTALSEMLMGKVKDVVEVVLSIFDELPQLFGGFLDFLGIVFPFLPSEITLLLTFGVIAVVFIGIIKAIRR